MRHLELHILQSVPVACLNRDELGSPKTAFFGGAQRARVSSQCWKRAVREYAKEIYPEGFQGERTKLIAAPLRERLKSLGLNAEEAEKGMRELSEALGKWDAEQEKKKGVLQIKTLFFTSPLELRTLAQAYVDLKDAKKAVKQLTPAALRDAADVALFGRMVADDHSLTVEGAAMFSHALSTHKADNEMDFYCAVDDRQPEEETGAGMMGALEFQSATYYRFVALNLDMLADNAHLGALTREEREKIVSVFVKACLAAVPLARKNSMNANTLPGYVLAVVRHTGHPIQLVNAFEKPVWAPEGGVFAASVQALNNEYGKLVETWDLRAEAVFRLPEVSLSELVAGVCGHVR